MEKNQSINSVSYTHLDVYKRQEKGFTKYLYNTVVVTGCCVLISVPTATLGAYGLIRNGGKFATRILNSTLLLRMFPQMLLAIPYFIIATNFGLADTKFILVVIVVASNQPCLLYTSIRQPKN